MLDIISRSVFSDGVSISSEFYSVETHLDGQENIITTLGEPSDYCIRCFPCNLKNTKWRFIAVFIFYLILAFIPKPLNLMYATLLSIRPFLSLLLLVPILVKLFLGKERTTTRYHTALHQVENAYNSIGRVPTLEEAKQSSTVSENCLLHQQFETILECTPLFIVALACNTSLKAVIALLVFFVVWTCLLFPKLKKQKFMYILDLLVLPKPTDKELQVVIECLNYVVKPSYEVFHQMIFDQNIIYVSKLNPSNSSDN